jgi:hypothetical protein
MVPSGSAEDRGKECLRDYITEGLVSGIVQVVARRNPGASSPKTRCAGSLVALTFTLLTGSDIRVVRETGAHYIVLSTAAEF